MFLMSLCRLVFKAWTDPEHLARWWGPHGFTNPVCEVDVRPGGGIRIDMAGPDGVVYPMKGTFHEVVEPERLVFISTPLEDERATRLEVLNTVTFARAGRQNDTHVRAAVVRATTRGGRAIEGWKRAGRQSLERLETELARPARRVPPNASSSSRGTSCSAIARVPGVDRARPPGALVGPKGFTMLSCTLDLPARAASSTTGCGRPTAKTCGAVGLPRGRQPPERLVFVASFSDEAGGVTRHPFTARILAAGSAVHAHLRRIRGSNDPHHARKAPQRLRRQQSFKDVHELMRKGWGCFDQALKEYLAQC